MYTARQYRITTPRLLRLILLFFLFWLLSSILSPLFGRVPDRTISKSEILISKSFISSKGLNVILSTTETIPLTIKLYTILGEEIENLCANRLTTPGTHHITYNISHLQPGIYFCSVEAGSRQVVHKLRVP